MENGRLGVPGITVAKLVEEEEGPEVGYATRLHQVGPREIALVHLHRQNSAMKKTVHHVRFFVVYLSF